MTTFKKIKVIPRCPKNEIAGELPDGTLKIRLTAAPTDGKANEALVKFLSREWGVAKTKLKIKSGFASRTKIIAIPD